MKIRKTKDGNVIDKSIIELRQKSQITIPKGIVKELNMNEGDRLEIYVEDGEIRIVPVVVYPVGYVEQLENELKKLRKESQ